MASTTTQPKAVPSAAFEQELIKMDQGVQSTLPAGTSLTINGTATKQAAIDTQLQTWIGIFKAVDSAKATYQNAVAARLAITVAARAYYKALKAVIKSYFGAQSAELAAFGLTADKPVATTTQAKMVAAAKRSQTRAVRGTKGKQQKLAITVVGNPPVTVPSKGDIQVGAPLITLPSTGGPASSVTSSTPSSTPSTAPSSTPSPAPASTAAPTPTPAPAGSGSGSGTPTSGSTPPVA